jgi:hypothetical protein
MKIHERRINLRKMALKEDKNALDCNRSFLIYYRMTTLTLFYE